MIVVVDKPSTGKITINGTNIYELSVPKQADRILKINNGKLEES